MDLGEKFWRSLYIAEYGESGTLLKNPDRSWYDYYHLTFQYRRNYTVPKALELVSQKGYMDLVKVFANMITGSSDRLVRAAYSAAKAGQIEILKYLVNSISDGMNKSERSTTNEERSTASAVLRRIARGAILNWNFIMESAAKGNHVDIIQYAIDNGADDWDAGLYGAAKGNNKFLVLFFIGKGSEYWNLGLEASAKGGNKSLIDFFIEKGANNWRRGIYGSARGGHRSLVDFFIKKCIAGGKTPDWNSGLRAAARGGHKSLIDFFVSKGANDWESALQLSIRGRHNDLECFFRLRLSAPIIFRAPTESTNHNHLTVIGADRQGTKSKVFRRSSATAIETL